MHGGTNGEYDYDVAVSFAGEDRTHVEAVVEQLKAHEVSVFYDQDYTAEMWGENLVDYLHSVYLHRARFVIIFVSQRYLEKDWTRHERQIAQDRALRQRSPYILPVRLDDAELPGLPSTTGYLDARVVGVDGIVEATLRKLGATRVPGEPKFNGRVPRTKKEIATVLNERPNCWEYLLYVGLLKQGIDALEDKYRDHVLEYAPRNGKHVRPAEAEETIVRNMTLLLGLVDSFERVLNPDAQDAAFGRRGESGDPDRIVHLARRQVSVYEEFLDLAADIRATSVASEAFRRILDIEAGMTNEPIERIREVVAELVRETDTMVERVMAGQDVFLNLVVKLKTDEERMERHDQAIQDFVREQRNVASDW